MKQYIEAGVRMFSLEILPDGPGNVRRTARVRIERGPGLTDEEAADLTKRLIAVLVAGGADAVTWDAGPGEE